VSGAPLSGIAVYLYNASDDSYRTSTSTDVTGTYRFGGLPAGGYKLQFYDSSGKYIGEYYNNRSNISSADPITLTAGMTATINVTLTLAAHITGTVTDEVSGAPLSSIGVYLYNASDDSYRTSTTTNVSGTYRFDGLPAGGYKLYFTSFSNDYQVEYYNNQSSLAAADPITLTSGTTTTINVALTPFAHITGTVTAENDGAPLGGIGVSLYDAADNSYRTSATTNVSGTYRFDGLPAGGYKLQFYDNNGKYMGEYYNNQPDIFSADPVTVTAGMTATANVSLTLAAHITGAVTDEVSGAPLSGIAVYLYNASDDSYRTNTTTNVSGTYRFDGLPAGGYKLRFWDVSYNYLAEYYDNRPNIFSADPVTVAVGMTATVNAALTPASTLTGTVTAEESGAPLGGIGVYLYNASDDSYRTNTTTNISGTYRFDGLPAGSYKLKFSDSNGVYLTEYYSNQPSLADADPVTLTTGMTATANAALTRGGHVTGRVTDAGSGTGIAGVSVNVYRLDASTASGSATTNANGYYTSTALYDGVYRVAFTPPFPYFKQYFDGFQNNVDFTPVVVTAGQTISNINAALHQGYSIAGTVTGSGPLAGVSVRAYLGSRTYYNYSKNTASDGSYQLGPLMPGQYRVRFVPYDMHYGMWYSGSATYAGATPLNLTASMTNINANLSYGGRITGTVTISGGVPLMGVNVYVYPAGESSSVASGYTDIAGHYATTPGLPTGFYQVKFSPPPGYTAEWYNDRPSQDTAAVISLTVTTTRTGINAQLDSYPNGAITGTVTAADTGNPLSIWVSAYNSQGQFIRSVYVHSGNFIFSGLSPDTYRLYFTSPPSPYVPVYYNNRFDFASADGIAVTAGATATVHVTIPRGGSITGTVTGSGGLPGVYVEARRIVGDYFVRSTYSGPKGDYTLEGLSPGDYRVTFKPDTPHVRQWYSSATEETTAQTVTVALNSVIPNINAALGTGAIITGVITAADTGLPMPGAYADVYSNTGSSLGIRVYADANGQYQTPGLPAGVYKLYFNPNTWSEYRAEWYQDADSASAAITITVPASGVVPNINAALSRGGALSGWVYDARTNALLNNVYVTVYSATSGKWIQGQYNNSWGYYRFATLPPGQYKVKFSKSGYADQWYDGAGGTIAFDSALSVTVAAGSEASNINAYLETYELYLPLILRDTP